MATRSAPRHGLFLIVALVTFGCGPTGDRTSRDAAHELPPDCAVLVDAARRAAGCDPALAPLADAIEREPDTRRCRTEARRLLSPEPPPEVESLYAPAWPEVRTPLSEAERSALSSLPLPATLRVRPDLTPAPGRPLTSARLDGRPLSRAEDGTITAYVAPGRYELELHHADDTRTHCVTLPACGTVRLTAHGAQVAKHEAITPGACVPATGAKVSAASAAGP